MIEALACGTPVIAFPEGAARELVIDGTTGLFAGFPAALTSVPVAFPTASRAQAWAAGAPLLLLLTILDLQPGSTDFEAELPDPIGHVAIHREPGNPLQRVPTKGNGVTYG